MLLIDALVEYNLANHRPEALRLVRNGQIQVSGKTITDTSYRFPENLTNIKVTKGTHPDNKVIIPNLPQEKTA